ncbi:N-acetyltransferase [Planococcus sp. CPCC 101016]|uniref:GNAT family N-acetyltransferase n=1 Tax=Planococcus sp. CPCC 101016 TaxID=2599617 RepID=UPI001645008F|nr:GNAT family N-acetyltransferase [Planococcus sp. CPCC 101016]
MIHEIDHQNEQLAKEIQEIQQAAYRIEAELMGFDGIPQLYEAVHEIQNSPETFIGYSIERLQGVVSYRVKQGIVDIHRLVVDPDHFRKGIGKQLIAYLLERYKGYEFMVSTGTANKPAIALYQANGFRELRVFEVAPGVHCTQFSLSN